MSIPSNLPQQAYIKAYYNLENVNDGSANGFNLTNNNSVTFSAAKIGNGADFGNPNSNKSLSIVNNFGITGGAITISMWVKLLAEIGTGAWSFAAQSSQTNYVSQVITYAYNAGARQLQCVRTKYGVASETALISATLGISAFHHIVYTYDGTNIVGYYDNTSFSAAASGNGSSTLTNYFTIGANNGAAFTSAIIDEVIVWNKALTSAEVDTVYKISSYPKAGGLGYGNPWIYYQKI